MQERLRSGLRGSGWRVATAVAIALVGALARSPGAEEEGLDFLFEVEEPEDPPTEEKAKTTPGPAEGEFPGVREEPNGAGEEAEPPPAVVKPELPAPALQPDRKPMIEQIVVTAQKRAESLQDVPITISALTGEDLAAKGVNSVTDLQYATPGLVINDFGSFPIIYLRGVGTDAFLPAADMSVANYLDGIYFPVSITLVRSLSSVERVEVIKGPQGTLFGRNATGGAISVVTREPSEGRYTGSVDVGYGSFDHLMNRFYLSGPLSGTVSFSLAGLYDTKNDPYGLAPESPVDHLRDERERAGTAKLRWAPGELFDATAAVYGIDQEVIAGSLLVNEETSQLADLQGGEPVRGDYRYGGNISPKYLSTNYFGSLTANLRPGPFDVKSITAYQDLVADTFFELDGTSTPIFENESHITKKGLIAKIFTQELQFLSNEAGWLSDLVDLEWLGGFYFLNSTGGFPDLILRARGDVPLGFLPMLNDGELFHTSGLVDTTSYAGFAQTTWSPLSWFDLTLGGRYQFEKRRIYRVNADRAVRDEENRETYTPINHFPPEFVSKGDFSPKIAIGIRPFLETLLFVSWQQAFKSGSYNIVAITEPPAEIRPEKITAIETGLKTDLFDGRVRFNASLFQNVIDDIQSQFLSVQSGGIVSFLNADKGTIRGAETDLVWAVTPALRLNTGYVFLHGKYDEFPDGVGFDEETGLYQEGLDFSGNRIVRNPEHTLTAAFSYGTQAPGGWIDVGGDCYYNSGFFFDAQNITEQRGFYTLGAHASYLFEPWNLRFSLVGTNLNEARIFSMRQTNDFGRLAKLAPPRAFFGTVGWEF